MTTRTNDAAQRAAEAAARARAEAAARARAEAAKAAQAAQANATKLKAAAKKLASRDELSTGRGAALRQRQLGATGGSLKGGAAPESGARMSVGQLLAAQKAGTAVGLAAKNALTAANVFSKSGAAAQGVVTKNNATQGFVGPPAPTSVTAAAQTPQAQAKADSVQVQKAWDTAKAAGKSDAQAARAATAELERLSTAHAGDPAYINSLVREAGPTLDKVATTLGANTEGAFKGGDDAKAIKDSIHSLSVVAEKGGTITAGSLATTLASKVDNDSELNQFDDGFYAHKDGGGTNLLFDATIAAMRAQGKDSAAGELAERGGDGGFIDSVKDGVGDVVGAVGDAFGAVGGFAKDLGEGVMHVVSEAGEFAVDVAKGTVDLIGDAASWTANQVGDAVKYAIEQGMKLAGPVLDKVRSLAREGIDKGLGITENINSLDPGDSVNIGGSFHAQLGVSVDASAEIQVQCEEGPNGTKRYTVSGEVDASVGIGVGGSGSAGVGGKMEFTFHNPEDAARAAKILASGAAGVAALAGPTAVLAPALLPGPGDLSFLNQHLKSVEVDASVGAHFDSVAGVAEADVSAESGYRLNFENGKPVSITRTTEISAEGSVGGPLELLKDSLGNAITIPNDAKASGSVTVETTIPIDGAGVTDLAAFIANPATAAVAGPATTSVTIEGSFEVGGDVGTTGSVTIDGIDASEVRGVVNKLLHGDAANAFKGVEVSVSAEVSAWHDDPDGFDFSFEGTALGQGVEVSAHNEVRREDWKKDVEVDLGQSAPPSGGGGRVLRS